ncbi:hypothetical protein LuPra_01526 [Luteitalea pratensis]|uniref:Serine protease n=1 Tax=Luteitalea pratensis TaxID=1855912 RepID=A0A143PID3_LUTPR|nr:hypothetical protein [Luteitalea pratensis]AMY08332.1 hypothetical protein LuPra_01526 [Luteitalea pratensis]
MQQDPVAEFLDRLAEVPERVELANGLRNFLPVCFLELGLANTRAVCKIDSKGTNFEGTPDQECTWTGFLVGRNLLLTNHHVLPSLDAAREAICLFNFQLGVTFSPLETIGIRLQPDRLTSRLTLTSSTPNRGSSN